MPVAGIVFTDAPSNIFIWPAVTIFVPGRNARDDLDLTGLTLPQRHDLLHAFAVYDEIYMFFFCPSGQMACSRHHQCIRLGLECHADLRERVRAGASVSGFGKRALIATLCPVTSICGAIAVMRPS